MLPSSGLDNMDIGDPVLFEPTLYFFDSVMTGILRMIPIQIRYYWKFIPQPSIIETFEKMDVEGELYVINKLDEDYTPASSYEALALIEE